MQYIKALHRILGRIYVGGQESWFIAHTAMLI